MTTYLDCWTQAATALFAQALAGEPMLAETPLRPVTGQTLAFTAKVAGEVEGPFSVILDAAVLETPLVGEGMDQQAGWGEILREVADAAAGDLLARTGIHCRVERFEQCEAGCPPAHVFELRAGARAFALWVCNQVQAPRPVEAAQPPPLGPGIELLLDVELEASLRFGCREMPLGQILDLGPGDVVQLDRHVSDPVDLIVGDKIVARGEVVLVNGNFGLKVTEVAAPRKRLESIRCLF